MLSTTILSYALVVSPAPAPQEFDRGAIDWHLPGSFEEAWATAKAQQRMLLIKGISFGVDEAGGQCATKGTW